jgi:hypothetical protein
VPAVTGTTIMTKHVSSSVEELLKQSDDTLMNLFGMDAETARKQLNNNLAGGDVYLKSVDCDNFHPKKGCLGHGEGVTEKVWVNSSNLSEAAYVPGDSRMVVHFKNGSVYVYTDVPAQTWNDFITAASGGSFLAKYIVKKFPSSKIG